MSSSEISQWMAYEKVTGTLGPERQDILNAILASTVANANRSKGKVLKPADFIPQWDGKRVQSPEEQLAVVKQINSAMGGVDKTEKKDN